MTTIKPTDAIARPQPPAPSPKEPPKGQPPEAVAKAAEVARDAYHGLPGTGERSTLGFWPPKPPQAQPGVQRLLDQADDEAKQGHHEAAANHLADAAGQARTQADALAVAKAANDHLHDGLFGLKQHTEYLKPLAKALEAATEHSETFKEALSTVNFAIHGTDKHTLTNAPYQGIDVAADGAALKALGKAQSDDELRALLHATDGYRSSNPLDEMSMVKSQIYDRLGEVDPDDNW